MTGPSRSNLHHMRASADAWSDGGAVIQQPVGRLAWAPGESRSGNTVFAEGRSPVHGGLESRPPLAVFPGGSSRLFTDRLRRRPAPTDTIEETP